MMKSDSTDWDFSESGDPKGPAIVLLVTGAPVSSNIGKLEFSYVFEFVPYDAYYPFCNM